MIVERAVRRGSTACGQGQPRFMIVPEQYGALPQGREIWPGPRELAEKGPATFARQNRCDPQWKKRDQQRELDGIGATLRGMHGHERYSQKREKVNTAGEQEMRTFSFTENAQQVCSIKPSRGIEVAEAGRFAEDALKDRARYRELRGGVTMSNEWQTSTASEALTKKV